ncbi:hypothetical protein ACWGE0_19505 [Lentzea sp. NPDC054927]
MLPDEELRAMLDDLASPDPRTRVIMLGVLADDPTGDPRLLPRITELVSDPTPVVLAIPYEFGEVRWAATRALAAERSAADLPPLPPVRLPSPLSLDRLSRLADEAGLTRDGGLEGLQRAYADLRDRGLVPFQSSGS